MGTGRVRAGSTHFRLDKRGDVNTSYSACFLFMSFYAVDMQPDPEALLPLFNWGQTPESPDVLAWNCNVPNYSLAEDECSLFTLDAFLVVSLACLELCEPQVLLASYSFKLIWVWVPRISGSGVGVSTSSNPTEETLNSKLKRQRPPGVVLGSTSPQELSHCCRHPTAWGALLQGP